MLGQHHAWRLRPASITIDLDEAPKEASIIVDVESPSPPPKRRQKPSAATGEAPQTGLLAVVGDSAAVGRAIGQATGQATGQAAGQPFGQATGHATGRASRESGNEDRVVALFRSRGLCANDASAVARQCAHLGLARSDVRNLAAALGRSEELRQRVASGALPPASLVMLPAQALAAPQQAAARQLDAADALKGCIVDPKADAFGITCDECGAEDALGYWILSSSGGKPQLGSARMVKRGECTACGHVWLDEGR